MSKINIQYMTDQALETLKANVNTVTTKLIENPESSDWLKDFVPCRLYETKKFEIEELHLKEPKNEKDKDTNIQNSILLYETLKDLPAYVISDEHFWMWMNFEIGYKVALKSMPVKEGSSVFRDHWLFGKSGKRRGLVFGVLSRCYFRVSMTVKPDDPSLTDKYELSRFAIENPARFRTMSWRTFSSNKDIVTGTLKAEKRIHEEYPDFQENEKRYFDKISNHISEHGSCILLDAMSESDVEEYVYDVYKKMVTDSMNSNCANASD